MHTRGSATAVGTLLRWVMWAVPAFLFLIGFFHRAAPGVIARDLMHAFDATGATIGRLAATYFYAYAALMIPAGLFVDAFGPRRVLTAGGAVMGLGALIMGAATAAPALFTGRLLVEAGASVTFVGTLKIAAAWFPPARFGFRAAVSATVGVLGALVSTLPLAALVERVGWRGAFWGVGLVTLAAAVGCRLVVRDRPPGAPAAPTPGFTAVVAGIAQVLGNPHTWPPFLAFFCLWRDPSGRRPPGFQARADTADRSVSRRCYHRAGRRDGDGGRHVGDQSYRRVPTGAGPADPAKCRQT